MFGTPCPTPAPSTFKPSGLIGMALNGFSRSFVAAPCVGCSSSEHEEDEEGRDCAQEKDEEQPGLTPVSTVRAIISSGAQIISAFRARSQRHRVQITHG